MVASSADWPALPATCQPWRRNGQHTEEILLELGYDWEGIPTLREAAAIA